MSKKSEADEKVIVEVKNRVRACIADLQEQEQKGKSRELFLATYKLKEAEMWIEKAL